MKTVFKLVKIITNRKNCYPVRKTDTCDLGLYSTLENAEKMMRKDVKKSKSDEQELMKEIAEDEKIHNDEENFGHYIVLAYKISECELDVADWINTQSVRTYTADGQSNDVCLLDHKCKRHFKGRTPDQIRFQPGDIVEVITNCRAELCVVWHAQPTVEDYKRFRQRCIESYRKMCNEKGLECKENECPDNKLPFRWDYGDDCYLVYSLGDGDTHFHPESPNVFFPTQPVPKSLHAKLKAKYEEMKM